MSDQQAQFAPPQFAPPQFAPPLPRPAPGKKSLVAGLAGAVSRHSYLVLAIIVVLTVLVIALYVYYHGFLFLGPYAAGAHGKGARSKKQKGAEAGAAPGADEKGDPETEQLIADINRR